MNSFIRQFLITGVALLLLATGMGNAVAGDKTTEPDRTHGAIQPRPGGGQVQLVVHDAHLELRFFNAAGQRVSTGEIHGVAVYRSPAHQRATTVLNPTPDENALRSADVIDGPFAFHAHVDLFRDGQTSVAQSYEFDFDRGAEGD